MIRSLGAALALAAALALPAAAQQQPQPSAQDQQARQQFEQDAKAWQDAYNRKDAHALAEMYAPDAVFSAGGHEARGRDAIERAFAAEFQQGPLANIVITVEEARSLGADHGWATGTWRGEATMQQVAMMRGMPSQNMPMMQGQGGPMMQGRGMPMMQGQGTSGPGGQRMMPVEGHWLAVADRPEGRTQILAHMSNLAMPAGGCPMCGAAGTTAPQGNR